MALLYLQFFARRFVYFCLYQPDIKAFTLARFNREWSKSRTRSDIVRTVTTDLAPQDTPI